MAEFTMTESSKHLLDNLFESGRLDPDILRSNADLLNDIESLKSDLERIQSEANALTVDLKKYKSSYSKVKRDKDNLAGETQQLKIKISHVDELSQMVDEYKELVQQLNGRIQELEVLSSVSFEGFYKYLKAMCESRTNFFRSTANKQIVVTGRLLDSGGHPTNSGFAFEIVRKNSNEVDVVRHWFN